MVSLCITLIVKLYERVGCVTFKILGIFEKRTVDGKQHLENSYAWKIIIKRVETATFHNKKEDFVIFKDIRSQTHYYTLKLSATF